MNTPRRPTIREVAAAAGVSIATVSRIINRQQRFSADVEARVHAAIKQLGYQQNPAARSMVTGQTGVVGLALFDIRNPHHANIMKGANWVALAHGYALLVVDMEESVSQEQKLLEMLSMRVDALIVSALIPDATVDWLAGQGKPVSFVGRLPRNDIAQVATDGFMAASMLGRYLIGQGAKRVAYVGSGRSRWNAARLDGLKSVLAEADLEPMVFDAGFPNFASGTRIASSVFWGRERPDAVVACNDLVALGMMAEAKAMGVNIPRDVGIVGFDNIPSSLYVDPPLTTVDMRSEDLGEAAMRQVLANLATFPERGGNILLEPRLLIRQSVQRASMC